MKKMSKSICSLVAALALTGSAQADSLWKPTSSRNHVGDKKARLVGDILNVIVQESQSLNKDKKTETERTSTNDASISSFLYGTSGIETGGTLKHNGNYPAMKFSSANSHKGSGKIQNSESIGDRFGVRVVDVLPNRNLVIEGTRRKSYSGESQTIILRGTVRWDDIGAQNSIYSYHISDLSLRYINEGELTSSQRKGWFKRFWDNVTPF